MSATEALAKTVPVVIVADDDDDIRITLCEILECEGFRAVGARNGSEALALVRAHPTALLVLDHRMPELTGADVVCALRMEGLDTNVVLMTADHHIRELAALLGIDHFIAKPFPVRSLLDLIARLAR
jgi:CheY-like chemotaxis protein